MAADNRRSVGYHGQAANGTRSGLWRKAAPEAEAAKDIGRAKAVAASTAEGNQILLHRQASAPCRQSIHGDPFLDLFQSRAFCRVPGRFLKRKEVSSGISILKFAIEKEKCK